MPTKHYISPFTLETLKPYLDGDEPWPEMRELAAMPASLGVLIGASITPLPHIRGIRNSEGRYNAARYFLVHTQGGAYTGEAYVLFSHWHQGYPKMRFIKVMACAHDPVSRGTREQQMRGWHPSKCSKCGLDMSVDSSG
jgi:hypothetical protein